MTEAIPSAIVWQMPRPVTAKISSVKFLAQLIWPHKILLVFGLIALAIGSTINLLIPQLARSAVDQHYDDLVLANPLVAGGWLVTLFAIQAIFFFWRSYYFYAIGQKVVNALRTKLFASLLYKPVAFFDGERVADLNSRIIADAQVVQELVSMRLSVLIRYTFQVVVGVILMCLISLRLSLLLALALPILTAIGFFLGRKLKQCSRNVQDRTGELAVVAEESLINIKLIKAFGQEQVLNQRFASSNSMILSIGLLRSRISAFFSSFVGLLMNTAIVAVLLYGITLASSGRMTYGDLTAFLLYGAIVAVSFSFIVSSLGEFLQGLGALDRINDLVDSTPVTAKNVEPTLKKPHGHIAFQQVSFSYPSRSTVPILNELSLELKPNTSTALIGPSGSGKSTIAALLLGLYLPDSGKITLDGTDLGKIDLTWYHTLTAFVPQDPALFAMSIRDNVSFGKPGATEAEILEACKLAKVLDFAVKLPQGLDTICGEQGHQLSGGERQRVAIARALIRNPVILVLDEPTSALDSESEETIRIAIDQLKATTTVLVIAHRLSTVRNVDQVLVLKDGRIIESGTHSLLSSDQSVYRQLLEQQMMAEPRP